jgi:hypothetical protein
LGLVVEDASKVVAIGEDIGLVRKVGTTAVDEVDARQTILLGDLLCSEMLFDGDGIVCAALDTASVSILDVGAICRDLRAVIGNNHAHGAFDCADACDDTSGSYFFSRIHFMAGQS